MGPGEWVGDPVVRVGEIQFGGVAQLGEHLLCKQGVVGSIPIVSTRLASPSGWINQPARLVCIAECSNSV
jgi:hypothetical protein